VVRSATLTGHEGVLGNSLTNKNALNVQLLSRDCRCGMKYSEILHSVWLQQQLISSYALDHDVDYSNSPHVRGRQVPWQAGYIKVLRH
jgi:hypothetical protein